MYVCTGIASRTLRPLLGIVDPLHVKHMPKNVAAYSGFDVLWCVGILEIDVLHITTCLPPVMHSSHTLLFLIRRECHAPPTPYIVPPTKAATPFQISGHCMLSESSKTTSEGNKWINHCNMVLSIPL